MKSLVTGVILNFELSSTDDVKEDRDGLRICTLLNIALKSNIAGKTS